MKRLALGQHLILDGYGCSLEKLIDQSLIWEFLNSCPVKIEMTKVSTPYVFEVKTRDSEDWGYSGFVLLAESHIFIHTFPKKGFLNLDIFSCRPFNEKRAIKYVTDIFCIKESKIRQIDRGIEFPLNEAKKIVSMHREAYIY